MLKNNKIAIVTGASSGLGQSICIKLALKGYEIILASRNQQKLKKVHKIIKNNGGKSKIIVTDVSKEDDIKKLYSKIDINRVDVLINNAGVGIFNKIQDVSVDDWDKQINTNLRGAFLMTKYISKSMINRRKGNIVFINSIAGINPYPYSSAYVTSKYGLRGFSSSLREEMREHNIKVISVHPGAIDTPFWNNIKTDFPKKEMMTSNDVADTVINAVLSQNNLVQEEIIIRRTAGDF